LTTRLIIAWCSVLTAQAAIIDRIDILVNNHVILDSDITIDIRVTAFLNGQVPTLNLASRKEAANRLIDQEIIREQVQSGNYPIASESEAEQLLTDLKRDRFHDDAGYQRTLTNDGLTEPEVKERLAWQLTVLRFIDSRFRPAVLVSDQDVQKYYEAHQAQFKRPLSEVRRQLEDTMTGERIDELLDEWLTDSRKQARIKFLEKALQ
jgi:hypothetical protein